MVKAYTYEVNVDEVTVVVTTLLLEDVDVNAKTFDTYNIVKNKMNVDSSETKIEKKRKKKSLEDKGGE